jgi:hypothetical protein
MHRLWAVALLPAICTMTCAATLPWPFDMRVEEVTSDRASFRVTTTGATFEFLPAEGTIAFSQRIEGPRRLGSLTVGPDALRGLRILEHSDESVKLRSASGVFASCFCPLHKFLRICCLTKRRPIFFESEGGITGSFR